MASASVAPIAAIAATAGTSVSSALLEPGSTSSHIGMPIAATATTFTALVIRNSSTDRVAIRSTERPLLRITHAPSMIPPRPLTETTALTASSASESLLTRRQPSRPNSSSNTIT